MKKLFLSATIALSVLAAWAQTSVETQRKYLSGRGCDDMVQWEFKCTGGRNSGRWTTIGVPSCWELQGFGTYQYGMRFYGKPNPEGIADEKGLYKYEFKLPKEWEGRQIELVFEAVMTDAKVTINGRKAGNGLHQGGFYRFSYDVSDRVFFGETKNRLEVEVSKESSNSQVNMAERRADYWNFGGIFRPVFVVAKPTHNIERVAIDAKADGRFLADVYLNRALSGARLKVEIVPLQVGAQKGSRSAQGKDKPQSVVATWDSSSSANGRQLTADHFSVDFLVKSVSQWTAETPSLYTAVFTLMDAGGKVLHREHQRFGFRTIEYRHTYKGAGLKPPHVEDADEDGLFVNGRKVIIKGVNRHSFRPESGRTLSKAKNIEDVRLIKSMNMNAVRLSHYPADPEFLDACDSIGLYVECELSGWHWPHETVIGQQLVKEMVTRDVNHPSILFWSNGNEGGFNYELEPEFARWDPQQRVVLYPWANRNGFETKHYRSWGESQEYMRQREIFMPTEFLHGLYDGGHGAGLADYWKMMMANPRCSGGFLWDLMDQGVVRTDRDGLVDCMGNFGSDGIVGPHMEKEGSYFTIKEVWSPVQVSIDGDQLTNEHAGLRVKNCYDFLSLGTCRFGYQYVKMPRWGQSDVKIVRKGALDVPDLEPGQSAKVALPPSGGDADALQVTAVDATGEEIFTWSFRLDGAPTGGASPASCRVSETDDELNVSVAGRTYRFSKLDGLLKGVDVGGRHISLANGPRFVAAKRSDRSQDGFYNHDDQDAFKKKTQYTEYADQGAFSGFKMAENGRLTATYRHGSLKQVDWNFASDGSVSVTAETCFGGVVDLMGVCFDYPETAVLRKSWVGKGPYRVWQNRMEGPQYGYWSNDYNDPIPGESFDYPEFKGYFAGVDWMQIETSEGKIGLHNDGSGQFVGVYQPRDGRDHLLYELPATGLSVLSVIPAVRNKVNTTDLNGPSAQPKWIDNSRNNTFAFTLKFE
ncbi:MAG: glycoside hydrolase family 2 [Prevotella sp.]|nr:glycoside hydrolase family 2 [Prevotella sp.]